MTFNLNASREITERSPVSNLDGPRTRPVIRLGAPGDAAAIAALHAESWRSAYRGLIPDDDLGDGLDDERFNFWRDRFASPGPHRRIVLAAIADEILIGFACVLADAAPEYGPLLDNLHVKPGWRGRGLGAELLQKSREWSRAIAPGQPMHLWVLAGNAVARRFYRNQGGVEEGQRVEHREGMEIVSLRCIWRE
jgi:GNAT superfamily N-acetyltransferase